jgi:hypothetical protein
MSTAINQNHVSDRARALLGFAVGFIIMFAVIRIFTVNSYDFTNMQKGISLLLSGKNPWLVQPNIKDFYNPPFSVLFLWPIVFATPKIYLLIGGSLLFSVIFYQKTWVALAWFVTNTALWIIAAGGIDMFVIGAGLLLLFIGDKDYQKRTSLLWRVLAYGMLMVKPQGAIFIVVLYILYRRDWKGLLVSILLYGVFFLPLYPSWISVLINNPPLAQTVASHTLWAKFGPWIAGIIAILVVLARRWKYWQLGGALAGIMTPYGMPGLPIFLILCSVKTRKAIPIVIIWSGCLAALTWVTPPPGILLYDFISPYMAIYHLSMLGLALVLACISPTDDASDTISVGPWIREKYTKWKKGRTEKASV